MNRLNFKLLLAFIVMSFSWSGAASADPGFEKMDCLVQAGRRQGGYFERDV